MRDVLKCVLCYCQDKIIKNRFNKQEMTQAEKTHIIKQNDMKLVQYESIQNITLLYDISAPDVLSAGRYCNKRFRIFTADVSGRGKKVSEDNC